MQVRRDRPTGQAALQVLLCLAALLVHAGVLRNGFAFDARAAVQDNPVLAQGSVARILGSDYWAGYHGDTSGLYRPLTVLSFRLNRRVLGPGPAGFHLVDLALHALATLLLFRLVRAWSGRAQMAAGAALVFAVHPAQSEAVASIVGRADLLAAACTFAAVGLHLRSLERPGWRAPAGAALALALGLLSKESTICAPALMGLAEAVAPAALQYRGFAAARQGAGPAARPGARPHLAAWALYLAVVGAYLLLRRGVLGGLTVGGIDPLDNPLVGLGPVLGRLNAGLVLWRYAGLLAFPVRLCADYSYAALPLVRQAGPAGLLTGAMALAVLGSVGVTWRRRPWVAAGAAWLALALLPVSNLLLPIGTMMAERLLYLPLAGLALAASAAVTGTGPPRRAVAVAAGLALGVAAALTVERERDWQSDYTLFAQAVEARPGSARAWRSYGRAALERGEEAAGLTALERALRLVPGYPEVHGDLAVHLLDRGRPAEAQAHLDTALALAPRDPTLWYDAGLARYRLGQRQAAGEAFARAVSLDTTYVQARYNLGVVLLEEGRLEEAAAAFAGVLALAPDHADAAANLSAVRRALERRSP